LEEIIRIADIDKQLTPILHTSAIKFR